MSIASPAPSSTEPPAFAVAIARIAAAAGAVAMRHFNTDCAKAPKQDGSPVTLADEDAEALILAGLYALDPQLPVIAEESAAKGPTPDTAGRFALVDPVDGTRDFLACRPEFTVNIAVIDAQTPVLGCIYAPALKSLYLGVAGEGAFHAEWIPGASEPAKGWRAIKVRLAEPGRLVALVSRSGQDPDTDAHLAALPVAERVAVASSLKFCLLAEGKGDYYPRFQRVMEWDIAAGHAILAAAGGRMTTPEGAPIRYGQAQAGFRAPMFIAQGA